MMFKYQISGFIGSCHSTRIGVPDCGKKRTILKPDELIRMSPGNRAERIVFRINNIKN